MGQDPVRLLPTPSTGLRGRGAPKPSAKTSSTRPDRSTHPPRSTPMPKEAGGQRRHARPGLSRLRRSASDRATWNPPAGRRPADAARDDRHPSNERTDRATIKPTQISSRSSQCQLSRHMVEALTTQVPTAGSEGSRAGGRACESSSGSTGPPTATSATPSLPARAWEFRLTYGPDYRVYLQDGDTGRHRSGTPVRSRLAL